VDYLQVLLENRAILWKKRRLIQTAAAQAAEESEDCWIESLQRIPEVIFQKKSSRLVRDSCPSCGEIGCEDVWNCRKRDVDSRI